MNERASGNELVPTGVANLEMDNILELRMELATLTQKAMEMAKSVVSKTQDVDAMWADLLPVLSEVQSLLSKHCNRRQERRASGFPTWEQWRCSFLKDSGLNVCDRTAQRRLSAFHELMAPTARKPGGHSEGVTPMERYQGLLAQQAANKLFDTLIEGDDSGDAFASFLDKRISPDRLQQMIARCPKPREASSIGGQASSNTQYTPNMFSLRFRGPHHSSECELNFQPGGWVLLADYIAAEHRQQFQAVFATLPDADKRRAFKALACDIFMAVVQLDLDEDDDKLMLSAETVIEELKPSETA